MYAHIFFHSVVLTADKMPVTPVGLFLILVKNMVQELL